MNRNDLERILTEIGRLDVAPPDEVTSARIASRWRHASGSPRSRVQARRRPRAVAVGGAIGLIAAAASIAVVVAATGTRNTSDLVVAAASGITVELPDGQTLLAQGGEVLPDGSIVIGGPGASGVIGGVYVGPASQFVVRNGRLQPRTDASLVDPASPAATDAAAALSTTTAPRGTRVSTTAAGSTPSTEIGASGAGGTPTSSPRRRPAPPARLSVQASARPGAAQITWAPPEGSPVVRYVVVRTKKWNGRTLPQGRRIAQVRSGQPLVAVDRKPQTGTFYVIAAYGPKNRLIAIGSVAAPTT